MPDDRLVLIPQGAVIPARAADDAGGGRARLGLREDAVVLLFVGGICQRKGVEMLVENHRHLVERISDLHLFLIGPVLEPDYAARLRRRVSELGIEDRVRFCGFVDDPAAYYALADILVFASHAEGFGNVLIEAMAAGLPVVSRLLPGVNDYFIEQDVTGHLFKDDAGYRDAVLRFAEDPSLRRAVGDRARAAVSARFSLTEIATRYVRLYRE
jgi:glycosyltransferase involved in cell wall biosynthesis